MSKYCNQYCVLQYGKIKEIMENAKQQIIYNLKKAIKDLTGLEIASKLSHPSDERHGDYSTNVAMILFSNQELRSKNQEWKSPLDLGQKIVEQFMVHNSRFAARRAKFIILSSVEAKPPGFINFWLSKEYLSTLMIRIIRVKEEYGRCKKYQNKKVMIEFTDPNPFKEFHIGHLYSNIVGESICRLQEANGAIVKRANYQGDVGMHVAKALYALLRNSKLNRLAEGQNSKFAKTSLVDKVKLLGTAYAFGARAYEEDESAKKEIIKINKQVYEKDPTIMSLYKKGKSWSLEYFETIYKRLGTHFDYYYFESEVGKAGLDLVRKYKEKGVFKESQGAVMFQGERHGLHNRVFINSQGFPTYEAKELGLAPTKYKDFKYDESIIVTGNEIIEYFKVLLIALKQIYPNLAAKTKHVSHGIVRLPKGKMSSRTGNVVTGEWLLDEAKSRIKSTYHMDEETAEKVAVGGVKYALLKNGIGRDIAFDFEESISLEGNSGPYLQYTFARTQSVLSKVKSDISFARSHLAKLIGNLKLEIEEISLLRTIYRFPEVVGEAAENFAPNLLCNYLFDLSQKFNLFYQKVPIIKQKHPPASGLSLGVNVTHPRGVIESSQFRLALTMAVGQIIKNGLCLLGIATPKRM